MYALLVLYFCSQSVKDLIFAPLLESECKGTTFFRTGKTIHYFFSRKTRKTNRLDKKTRKKKRKRLLMHAF